ncbi:Spore coat protein CotH [Streptomyces graminofaciens]|uniref:Spore coat protein CotH n=1 Tax=Streptomyces graminofaciens TaxID=68212 RepID=A0ABM7F5S0_9ACTN|nr:CotH kinase family protein [Streptomyces graminofaciens]BBC31100.1 Spore coat protein CotH [Streptomyces graminofaciens]
MSGHNDTTPRRRRLRDRIPVRLRHHWKPAGALCAGLAVMVYFFGDARVSPYVTSSSRVEADTITENVEGTVDLYDTSVSHSIQLEYDQTDFTKMMKEFREDGTKDYIEADLTIDGVYLEDVGIRLKGNSTLMSLRGSGQGMPGGGRTMPEGAAQGAPDLPQDGGTGSRDRGQGNGGGPGGAGGAMGGITQYNLSDKKPEELPWLIKVDEFIEGRAYQGEREISLRPGSNGQVPVNEALSLSLTDTTGRKNERYAFTSVKVNSRPVATRLMVESPDTEYAESIGDGNGVLYKARAGGGFEYKGDDPSDYENSFEQLNKVGSQDLEPVMKLIKWANQASDEEFEKELDQYVDVESLATYLAAQNLLMNFDDMAGPGKNYLLWYDLDTKKFSVLGWDYNLTFSGDATSGPDDDMGMGGAFGGGGGAADGQSGRGGQAAGGQGAQNMPSGAPSGMPEGMPEGMPSGMPENLPEGMPSGIPSGMPGGGQGGQGGQGEGGGFGGLMGHPLKERFLDSDTFDPVYKKAYRELYEKFYGSGTALKALNDIAEQAGKAGADGKELDSAVEKLRKTVTERTDALAKNTEVTG